MWYGGEASKTSAAPQSDSRRRLLHLAPLHLDTTGRTLTQPEAELIERYVAWLGGTDDRFLGGKLDRENLYIDLFVRGPNLLIEAKSHADRDSVRMAVGQLRDYRHFLERRCKMAVLLPQKPNPSVLRYLERERIACIWETPTRRFGDSVAGKGSSVLRR